MFPFVIDRLSERFSGTAREVVPVDGYVYVLVDVDGAARWVVSRKKHITVGAVVDVTAFGSAEGFVSKQLGRTFERLWFAVVAEREMERGS